MNCLDDHPSLSERGHCYSGGSGTYPKYDPRNWLNYKFCFTQYHTNSKQFQLSSTYFATQINYLSDTIQYYCCWVYIHSKIDWRKLFPVLHIGMCTICNMDGDSLAFIPRAVLGIGIPRTWFIWSLSSSIKVWFGFSFRHVRIYYPVLANESSIVRVKLLVNLFTYLLIL